MPAWHESSPFLDMSCCAPSSRFLLSKKPVGRSFAAPSHPPSSAFRSWSLLCRGRTKAPLAPSRCRGQTAAGCPFRLRPRMQRPRRHLTACAIQPPRSGSVDAADLCGKAYALPCNCHDALHVTCFADTQCCLAPIAGQSPVRQPSAGGPTTGLPAALSPVHKCV